MKKKLKAVIQKAIQRKSLSELKQALELNRPLESLTNKEIENLFVQELELDISQDYEGNLSNVEDNFYFDMDVTLKDKGRYFELNFNIGIDYGIGVEPTGSRYTKYEEINRQLSGLESVLKSIPEPLNFLNPSMITTHQIEKNMESEYFGTVGGRNLYTVKL